MPWSVTAELGMVVGSGRSGDSGERRAKYVQRVPNSQPMTTRPAMMTPTGGSGAAENDGAAVAGTPLPWITRSWGRPGAGAATHADDAIAATIANAKKRTPPNGRIGRLTLDLRTRFPSVGGPILLLRPPLRQPASAFGRLELARVRERLAARGAAERHRLAVDAHGVIDAHHHDIPRRGAPQRQLHRRGLVEDLLGAQRAGATLATHRLDPVEDVGRALARLPPAQIAVLAHDDLVERRRGEGAVLALIVVAAIARDADDADRPPASEGMPLPAPRTPALVGASSIRRFTKSASWRIPSTLWQ